MSYIEMEQEISCQQMQIEDLLADLAECKRDAERYRWLRHALSDRSNNGKSHHFCSISSEHPEELDEAIDAAIAAMREKK